MPRYIDADKLIEHFDDVCRYAKPTNDYQRGCNDVFDWGVKIIKNMPTADVVPKSEVEMLQGALKAEERHNELTMQMAQKALKNAKSEVAREIFEEIREIGSFGEPIVDYICMSFDELAELKKKYTGDQNDG